MTVRADRHRYLRSLSNELAAQADRVRDLIGDRHWLSDGHHKEALLIHLLQRHMPAGIRVGRGFVVSSYDSNSVSREQDALLLDTTREAPLFTQDDLVVALPSTVVAAISVKTSLTASTVRDSFDTLRTARDICGDLAPSGPIWCGAFFFGVDEASEEPVDLYRHMTQGLNELRDKVQKPIAEVAPDFVATAAEFAFRFDRDFRPASDSPTVTRIRGFGCSGLATAVFLSDLLAHIAQHRGPAINSLADLIDNNIVAPLTPAEATLS